MWVFCNTPQILGTLPVRGCFRVFLDLVPIAPPHPRIDPLPTQWNVSPAPLSHRPGGENSFHVSSIVEATEVPLEGMMTSVGSR